MKWDVLIVGVWADVALTGGFAPAYFLDYSDFSTPGDDLIPAEGAHAKIQQDSRNQPEDEP
jgi:hypothetical protein